MYERVADFYEGKSILLTGATGFLGGVLLELLLRCCPGLKTIFLVLREKKDVPPIERRTGLLNKKIFTRLRNENPEALEKVRVVSGDISKPDFGIEENELEEILEEVNIVFHCAALISFRKSLLITLTHNVLSVKYAIDLCRKLKRLDVLVYTSTAYSNCNKPLHTIDSIVYRLPYHGKRYLEVLEKKDSETLEYLAKSSGPAWPNPYTFSKCVAENVIQDTAQDLPVAIVRPSIIVYTWKGTLPGYAERGSGVIMMSLGVGRGFIRVLHCNPDIPYDMVPADIAANAHVLTAFKVATQKYEMPLVINCASRIKNRITFREFTRTMLHIVEERPMKGSLQLPSLVLRENNVSYWISTLLEHFIPAFVFDNVLRVMGKKPRLVNLYRFFERTMSDLFFFLTNEFDQNDDTLRELATGLHKDDTETFTVDVENFKLSDVVHFIPDSFPSFEDQDENERLYVYLRSAITFFIKYSLISFIIYLFLNLLYYIYVSVF